MLIDSIGQLEIIRDFYNSTHHEISKLEQLQQLNIIELTDEQKKLIEQHETIEKILMENN